MPLIIVALLYFGGWFVIWLLAAALLVGIVGFGTVASIMSGDPTQAGVAMLATLGVGSLVVLLLATLLGIPLMMALLVRAGAGAVPRRRAVRGDEGELHRVHAQHAAVPGLWTARASRWRSSPRSRSGSGWLVLLPVYAASVYASYKDIFGDPSCPTRDGSQAAAAGCS